MADDGWIRMYDIFGKSVVPANSAEIIIRAVRKAVKRGDVASTAKWQLVEFWAADYLAGVETDRQERLQAAVDEANEEA
jgi:hypothetical protein